MCDCINQINTLLVDRNGLRRAIYEQPKHRWTEQLPLIPLK